MSAPVAKEIFSVSDLNRRIKHFLEAQFYTVYVKGEITNLKVQSSGHAYFSLKDEHSQISAVMFKSAYSQLSTPLKAGDKVLIKGQLNVYPPRGSYQIVVQKLRQEGLGDLLLKLHELKAKLQKEGYFESNIKKNLPKFPKVIGVITSPTGSVIQDIIHVLSRRAKGFTLLLNPVKVQGDGAEGEIAAAIEEFNKSNLADVLIVGRGGGSLEDLWAFNSEAVTRAIYESKIPVVSAVGHETDVSLADLAADVRAPTPSAAAEIVIKEQSVLMDQLERSRKMLDSYVTNLLNQGNLKIRSILKQPVFSSSEALLLPFVQKLDEKVIFFDQRSKNDLEMKKLQLNSMEKRLRGYSPTQILKSHLEKKHYYNSSIDRSLSQKIILHSQILDSLRKSIDSKFYEIFKSQKERLDYLKNLLSSIDPKNVLKKGYCIPFAENKNSVIISSNQLSVGDTLNLRFFDGEVKAKVLNKKTSHE